MFRKLLLVSVLMLLPVIGCRWAIQTVEVSSGVFISAPVTLAPTSPFVSPTPDTSTPVPVTPTEVPSVCGLRAEFVDYVNVRDYPSTITGTIVEQMDSSLYEVTGYWQDGLKWWRVNNGLWIANVGSVYTVGDCAGVPYTPPF